MIRVLASLTVIALIACIWSIAADDPPRKLTADERKELDEKLKDRSAVALKHYQAGEFTSAHTAFEEVLAISRRRFPTDEFPNGHVDIANSLNNLALLLQVQGKLAEAEPYYRECLEMKKHLYKGDHRDLARSLNNLATLLQAQGKQADAEPICRDALAMYRRLFQEDHSDVAMCLNNLGVLLQERGKLAEAESLHRESLAMKQRMYKGDHAEMVNGLHNMGLLLKGRGKLDEAEPYYRQSLEMSRRLHKGDHPDIAGILNNTAFFLEGYGKLDEAETLYRECLAMRQRLFKGDHPAVANTLHNLAGLLHIRGMLAEAESHGRESLRMHRRLIQSYATQKTEGDALNLLVSMPLARDGFLSVTRARKVDPATVYPEVWAEKAAVARIYEQRLQAARAATDPRAAKLVAELADTRRRRAELILAPQTRDPAIRQKRNDNIKSFDGKIAELDRALRPLLPTIQRAEQLARANPSDLQKALPGDAVVVDFLRYVHFDYQKDKNGTEGLKRSLRYLAFVMTSNKLDWVELGLADPIDEAIESWREAITSGKDIPDAIPAKVRELVWDKVRKQLPATAKVVYLSPDWVLSRIPWGALPGDKPGTIVLEEFAVAVIPYAPFLLDQFWPQDALKNPPSQVLVIGGVDYQAELPVADKSAMPDPPMKSGPAHWSALLGAAGEASGVARAAKKKSLIARPLKAEQATTTAVLAELPKARYAHFATHGFFATETFGTALQLDLKNFERTSRGERIGAGARSPLVMTGLVFAGANHPKTPARGILTGESLIDLDLSGLELAVLSACETGLGEVSNGEGTFGLQRAFHMAGTKNVVASLWMVPDHPTAALMALFYQNLWEKNLSPMAALREAQLEIYRNPQMIVGLAKSFRGKFDEVPGASDAGVKAGSNGKTHPRLWAAFSLSGLGR